MEKENLEVIVREVLQSMQKGSAAPDTTKGRLLQDDFPLQDKRPDLIKSRSGKKLDELTLDAVMKGDAKFQDFLIHPNTLEYQAEIAEAVGRPQLANNFRRAKELTAVPDERILELYNSLRPYRSSKEELLANADELRRKFNATACAQLFVEAAEIYEQRGMLR